MMTEGRPYSLEILSKAEDALARLDRVKGEEVFAKLEWLAANADTLKHKAMKGQWKGYFRLRIGDYRAIYRLDRKAQTVIIHLIGHRREIYDK